MKALLWIVAFDLIKSVTARCLEGNIQLYHASQEQTGGVVQVCYQGRWLLICEDDTTTWGSNETIVICQHLGFTGSGSTTPSTCTSQPEGTVSERYLRFFRCPENVTGLTECYYESRTYCEVAECNYLSKVAAVNCMNVSCSKENIRLVDGSTDQEGRVEVCVDGRWRAVCSEGWTQEQAGLLCGKMGFLDYGTEIRVFHPHKVPLLVCSVGANTIDLVCNHTTICDMDLGIKCLSRNLLKQILNRQQEQQITLETSTSALGGVIGVLLTVLVVLVIGWSLSCVALVKRNSTKQEQIQFHTCRESYIQQLDNPAYEVTTKTHNYSSSGPTYELVDTNEGAGQTYAALQPNSDNSNAVQATSVNEEGFHHTLESARYEGVTVGECEGVGDYEVPVLGQIHSGGSRWLCEEEYSTLKH